MNIRNLLSPVGQRVKSIGRSPIARDLSTNIGLDLGYQAAASAPQMMQARVSGDGQRSVTPDYDRYMNFANRISPAEELKLKGATLNKATAIDRDEMNQLQRLIADHGITKVLGLTSLGGGATAAAIAGTHSILTPEEEAIILQGEREDDGSGIGGGVLGGLGGGIGAAALMHMLQDDEQNPMDPETQAKLDEITRLENEVMKPDDGVSSEVSSRKQERSGKRPTRR